MSRLSGSKHVNLLSLVGVDRQRRWWLACREAMVLSVEVVFGWDRWSGLTENNGFGVGDGSIGGVDSLKGLDRRGSFVLESVLLVGNQRLYLWSVIDRQRWIAWC